MRGNDNVGLAVSESDMRDVLEHSGVADVQDIPQGELAAVTELFERSTDLYEN